MENSETPTYPEGRDLLKGKAVVTQLQQARVSVLLQRRDVLKKEQEFCYQTLMKID